ncbi:hypothetical protein [Pontibacter ruber]|uniref:Glycosyltransferase involved in cell wall biosynthesis n=1 Tax=Pontibacter ruber TaxID=1343895 RepID=A0ABW5CRF6_9BACT|nr:hypothetical protein [Pontibacter ruber]
MKKIAIIHFQPLEYYPPIINTINFLDKKNDDKLRITVYSSLNVKGRRKFISENISIKRTSFPKESDSSFLSFIKQLWFNFYTISCLLFSRPDTILYYESYSAFPAFIYLKYINPQAKLIIHFHEYFTKDWYIHGMKLVKFYHKLEVKYLFKKSNVISHTNEDRVLLFLHDYPFIEKNKMKILPNYPPSEWSRPVDLNKGRIIKPVRVVYIGSLSLATTYIKEFCNWVLAHKGELTFDIYCYNLDKETEGYLTSCQNEIIRFYPNGVDYKEIPSLLRGYDAGVILYKGLSYNFIYNAPNKLFEYLACGLDVWFSDKMIGILPYIKEDTFPKVIKVDFENLFDFQVDKAISKEGLHPFVHNYFSENVNSILLHELI